MNYKLQACQKKIDMPYSSPLRNFAPFIDDNGLLRVGGRLENSEAEYEQKHQIFVPPESSIGRLLIRNAHYRTLHGGISLNKAYLRQWFWFNKIGIAIRQFTQRCPICVRHKKRACEQLMGQLPSVRVTVADPFSRVGVDYAGPFKLRKNSGRALPL